MFKREREDDDFWQHGQSPAKMTREMDEDLPFEALD